MLTRLGREGPEGFEAARARMAAIPDDEIETQIKEHRETALGKQEAAESHLAAAKAKTGARYAGVERLKKEAEARLEEEGRFQETRPIEDAARATQGFFIKTAPREQIIGERARVLAEQEAGEAHVKMPTIPGQATDELIRRSLNKVDRENIEADPQEKMHQELVRQTQLLDRIAQQGNAKKPALVAPPPQVQARH